MGEEADKLPIKMLNDRILVRPASEGERRTSAGILIPATAEQKKRLIWAELCAMGPNVRTMEIGAQVLFSPEDRSDVEVRGDDYIRPEARPVGKECDSTWSSWRAAQTYQKKEK